jgi:hypothetical protein
MSVAASNTPDPVEAVVRRVFARFITEQRWCGWKHEELHDPDGNIELIKMPYVLQGGRLEKARSDVSGMFMPFDAAWQFSKEYGNSGLGVLLGLFNRALVGIDLDTCRNADTGQLEPWAQAAVAGFDTYTEVSPSSTGVKLFLELPTELVGDAVALLSNGRQWKRGAGKHPPGIEVYDGKRYFTVTGQTVGAPEIRRLDSLDSLRDLVGLDGPLFKLGDLGEKLARAIQFSPAILTKKLRRAFDLFAPPPNDFTNSGYQYRIAMALAEFNAFARHRRIEGVFTDDDETWTLVVEHPKITFPADSRPAKARWKRDWKKAEGSGRGRTGRPMGGKTIWRLPGAPAKKNPGEGITPGSRSR